MLRAVLVSVACAVPCSIVAVWAAYSVRGESLGWPPLLVWAWCGIVYAAVVMACWSGLYLGIKHYQLFRSEHARARQAEELARSAKLQALRFQLQPHFLFNTLNAISTLMLEGHANEASHMVVQLGNFLRRTLSDSSATEIPLKEELANLQEYINIEQARLGDRLKVEFLIAPEVACAVIPPLLLQPLVENAIYHGIAARLDGGTLRIEARRAGSRLCLRVCDTGAGVQSTRRGIGLTNTFERLRVLYGDDQDLAVRCPNGGGCLVEIDLPYSTSPAVRSDIGEPACVS